MVSSARDRNVSLGFTLPKRALGFQDELPLSLKEDALPGLEEDAPLGLEDDVPLGLEEDASLGLEEDIALGLAKTRYCSLVVHDPLCTHY